MGAAEKSAMSRCSDQSAIVQAKLAASDPPLTDVLQPPDLDSVEASGRASSSQFLHWSVTMRSDVAAPDPPPIDMGAADTSILPPYSDQFAIVQGNVGASDLPLTDLAQHAQSGSVEAADSASSSQRSHRSAIVRLDVAAPDPPQIDLSQHPEYVSVIAQNMQPVISDAAVFAQLVADLTGPTPAWHKVPQLGPWRNWQHKGPYKFSAELDPDYVVVGVFPSVTVINEQKAGHKTGFSVDTEPCGLKSCCSCSRIQFRSSGNARRPAVSRCRIFVGMIELHKKRLRDLAGVPNLTMREYLCTVDCVGFALVILHICGRHATYMYAPPPVELPCSKGALAVVNAVVGTAACLGPQACVRRIVADALTSINAFNPGLSRRQCLYVTFRFIEVMGNVLEVQHSSRVVALLEFILRCMWGADSLRRGHLETLRALQATLMKAAARGCLPSIVLSTPIRKWDFSSAFSRTVYLKYAQSLLVDTMAILQRTSLIQDNGCDYSHFVTHDDPALAASRTDENGLQHNLRHPVTAVGRKLNAGLRDCRVYERDTPKNCDAIFTLSIRGHSVDFDCRELCVYDDIYLESKACAGVWQLNRLQALVDFSRLLQSDQPAAQQHCSQVFGLDPAKTALFVTGAFLLIDDESFADVSAGFPHLGLEVLDDILWRFKGDTVSADVLAEVSAGRWQELPTSQEHCSLESASCNVDRRGLDTFVYCDLSRRPPCTGLVSTPVPRNGMLVAVEFEEDRQVYWASGTVRLRGGLVDAVFPELPGSTRHQVYRDVFQDAARLMPTMEVVQAWARQWSEAARAELWSLARIGTVGYLPHLHYIETAILDCRKSFVDYLRKQGLFVKSGGTAHRPLSSLAYSRTALLECFLHKYLEPACVCLFSESVHDGPVTAAQKKRLCNIPGLLSRAVWVHASHNQNGWDEPCRRPEGSLAGQAEKDLLDITRIEPPCVEDPQWEPYCSEQMSDSDMPLTSSQLHALKVLIGTPRCTAVQLCSGDVRMQTSLLVHQEQCSTVSVLSDAIVQAVAGEISLLAVPPQPSSAADSMHISPPGHGNSVQPPGPLLDAMLQSARGSARLHGGELRHRLESCTVGDGANQVCGSGLVQPGAEDVLVFPNAVPSHDGDSMDCSQSQGVHAAAAGDSTLHAPHEVVISLADDDDADYVAAALQLEQQHVRGPAEQRLPQQQPGSSIPAVSRESVIQEYKDRLSPQQYQYLREAVVEGRNVFITGEGGYGKSHLLDAIRHCLGKVQPDSPPGVCSMTGASAYRIGSLTLHALCSLKPGEYDHSVLMRNALVSGAAERYREWSTLILDECSMLSRQQLEALDRVFREVRGCQLPFGGLQVIFVGDFLQLPPVPGQPGRRVHRAHLFCFLSAVWDELRFVFADLDEVAFRYDSKDATFRLILSRMRVGWITPEHFDLLTRSGVSTQSAELGNASLSGVSLPGDQQFMPGGTPDAPVRIKLRRANVVRVCQEALSRLPGEELSYAADDRCLDAAHSGTYQILLSEYMNAPQHLKLKVGALVRLTSNINISEGLHNGAFGRVTELPALASDGPIMVQLLSGGDPCPITRVEAAYSLDGQDIATRLQFPLRLGYACTVHSVQGLSLDFVFIDFVGGCFAGGQAYTAVSRARCLAGLRIVNLKISDVYADPQALDFYVRNNSRRVIQLLAEQAAFQREHAPSPQPTGECTQLLAVV